MFAVLSSPLTLFTHIACPSSYYSNLQAEVVLRFAGGGGGFVFKQRLVVAAGKYDEVYSEATRMCRSRSREHKGRRCYNRNCNIICKHEGFVYGRCSRYRKCYCVKPCADGGGQEGPNPGQDPPPTPSLPKSSMLA
ncbi:hypothetical protein BUALT_Bualt16G0090600 [Buddleja alternifolia]|uniref:Knottins-like domain-containing protein n=1 Tax=Buddleja alternifolia TaxID=168488 RepID=A0AAV6WC17_9LAMI|nr:hypothetical protein BUALT_Bualt16G0090600 [Buddleja alternifolia]